MAHLGDTKAVSLTLLDGVIGNLNPKTTQVYDLGTNDLKWNNIYGNLKGTADAATKDGSGNTITSKYVTLDTTQTITGVKTFSTASGFNYSGIENATTSSFRTVWFSHNTNQGVPTTNESFKYNPYSRTLDLAASTLADGAIKTTTGTITINAATTLYLKSSGSGTASSIIFQQNTTELGRFNTNKHFIPGTINGSQDIGSSTNKWGTVYATTFNGSTITNGTYTYTLPSATGTLALKTDIAGYCGNVALASTASYNTTPEVASVKIGNGTTATSTKNVVLQYDSTNEVLNFTFT